MRVVKGNGVSKGHAIGVLFRYSNPELTIHKEEKTDKQFEFERFIKCKKRVSAQYAALIERYEKTEAAELFEAYQILLNDPNISERIWDFIRDHKCNVEYAISQVLEKLAEDFQSFDDEYMKARSHDFIEIKHRLLEAIYQEKNGSGIIFIDNSVDTTMINTSEVDEEEKRQRILVAEQLTAVEIAQMDCSKIRGIVLTKGSQFSHSTIFARNRGIPMIIGVDESIYHECSREALMNGATGEIILEFNEKEISKYLEQFDKQEETAIESETMDVYYSIGAAAEIDEILERNGQGIGLYRTELQYLKADSLPTEEELYEEYNAVVSEMCGRPVIIRTMDLGGDKAVAYLRTDSEEQSGIENRGVRLSLQNKDAFLAQLRAIYRASADSNVSLMFPMLTSVQEFRDCKELCERAIEELLFEGQPIDRHMEIGAMIETPEAVLAAKDFAREADFLSIGTNDLSHYLMSCDRQNEDMQEYFEKEQDKIKQAIRMCVEAAQEARIPVMVCGELTLHEEWRRFFGEIGVTAITMEL